MSPNGGFDQEELHRITQDRGVQDHNNDGQVTTDDLTPADLAALKHDVGSLGEDGQPRSTAGQLANDLVFAGDSFAAIFSDPGNALTGAAQVAFGLARAGLRAFELGFDSVVSFLGEAAGAVSDLIKDLWEWVQEQLPDGPDGPRERTTTGMPHEDLDDLAPDALSLDEGASAPILVPSSLLELMASLQEFAAEAELLGPRPLAEADVLDAFAFKALRTGSPQGLAELEHRPLGVTEFAVIVASDALPDPAALELMMKLGVVDLSDSGGLCV